MKTPAAQIRALLDSGLSQVEIATAVQVSQPTISRLLSGAHGDTRSEIATRINDLYEKVMAARKEAA